MKGDTTITMIWSLSSSLCFTYDNVHTHILTTHHKIVNNFKKSLDGIKFKVWKYDLSFFISIFSYITLTTHFLQGGKGEEEAIGFHIQFVVGNDAVK